MTIKFIILTCDKGIDRVIQRQYYSTVGPSGDLISQTQTVSFVSDQTFVDTSFVFMDDTTLESDETFGVELVPRNDLTFGVPSSVILTIIDDDSEKYFIIFILLF